jgi:hypothetical protein
MTLIGDERGELFERRVGADAFVAGQLDPRDGYHFRQRAVGVGPVRELVAAQRKGILRLA